MDRRALRRARRRAIETPLGLVPRYDDLDWSGLERSRASGSPSHGDSTGMLARELAAHDELFGKLGKRLPAALAARRAAIACDA